MTGWNYKEIQELLGQEFTLNGNHGWSGVNPGDTGHVCEAYGTNDDYHVMITWHGKPLRKRPNGTPLLNQDGFNREELEARLDAVTDEERQNRRILGIPPPHNPCQGIQHPLPKRSNQPS